VKVANQQAALFIFSKIIHSTENASKNSQSFFIAMSSNSNHLLLISSFIYACLEQIFHILSQFKEPNSLTVNENKLTGCNLNSTVPSFKVNPSKK